eukprot:scaffold6450_cov415-Prasinococcus_capsulatus_cf.AAC.2
MLTSPFVFVFVCVRGGDRGSSDSAGGRGWCSVLAGSTSGETSGSRAPPPLPSSLVMCRRIRPRLSS